MWFVGNVTRETIDHGACDDSNLNLTVLRHEVVFYELLPRGIGTPIQTCLRFASLSSAFGFTLMFIYFLPQEIKVPALYFVLFTTVTHSVFFLNKRLKIGGEIKEGLNKF